LARQAFHALNLLGVRPNTAVGIGMDARDPLTAIARQVEAHVPFFKDRVNRVRRQLRGSDTDIVTIATLRGACITLAEGIGGVRYGARPVLLPDDRHKAVLESAVEWFSAVSDAIGPVMEDREKKLASSPSVLAAIGAMGHELVNIENSEQRRATLLMLIKKLQLVNWSRGKHWEGIAGKFTPSGTFSIGGSKETAYAIYGALSDETSPAFNQVRSTAEVAVPCAHCVTVIAQPAGQFLGDGNAAVATTRAAQTDRHQDCETMAIGNSR
jgi:DNA sulfur modification protein DndB